MIHRLGRVDIGEASVAIAVSSGHRHAAFEACHFAINQLKETVPIWKKELYEGGELWIGSQTGTSRLVATGAGGGAGVRNIRKAVHAGYCWGVERAIDMVVQTTETHHEVPVRTLGPIIHNPQVVQSLADKGASTIDSLDEMPAGGTVIIRTHGVAPEVYQQAESKKLTVVDATCPLVTLCRIAPSSW